MTVSEPSAASLPKGVRVSELAGGLRVATDAMDHLETASVGVWVDVGARYEDSAVNGVSHLLEHMAFKGTERRSARDIAEEIEAVGGHLNAYTSREVTAYYARVLGEDTALALDVISDIVLHPIFAPRESDCRLRSPSIMRCTQAFRSGYWMCMNSTPMRVQ